MLAQDCASIPYVLCGLYSGDSRSARRSTAVTFRLISQNEARAAPRRAMKTRSIPGWTWGKCARTDSRRRRRTRLRVTALPMRFDVTKPHRLCVRRLGLTTSRTVCADHAFPSAKTAAKSRCFLSFSVCFNPHTDVVPGRRIPAFTMRQRHLRHRRCQRAGEQGAPAPAASLQ